MSGGISKFLSEMSYPALSNADHEGLCNRTEIIDYNLKI